MPKYTTTCQKCGRPFTEVRVCCDNGGDGNGGHVTGRCVDCCHGHDRVRLEDERVQRQRLSSAAPDLLAALEGVMIWVGCSPRKDQMADYSDARGAALSAIARAKGGQS